MSKYEEHTFFCATCGKKTYPLARNMGHQHRAFHLKDLYCPWCKRTTKCVEIKNDIQKDIFLKNFQEGKYNNVAKKACYSGRYSWLW